MSQIQSLILEARTLATQINRARLEGFIPSDDATVRLVEVTDLLIELRKAPPTFSEYARKEGE